MTEKISTANKEKFRIKIIDVIYAIGVLIVIYHLGLAAFAGNVVPYPDAMLPYTYLEIVSMRLAFGAIPMIIASVFFWRRNRLSESVHKKRNRLLVFLPSAICLLCMIFYVALFIWMMASFAFHYGTYGMYLLYAIATGGLYE